jgi:hypothetical protein
VRITLISICTSCVESIGEQSSFGGIRDAEIQIGAIYQTMNLDDYGEEQKATF